MANAHSHRLRWLTVIASSWTLSLAGIAAGPAWIASAAESEAKGSEPKKFEDWDKVTKDAKKVEGLFNLYFNEKEQKLFLEIPESKYDKELIFPIAIARGTGLSYLGGETLNFGNQWILSFRRAADRILVVRRNIRYRAEEGSPQAEAVKTSYTDSIIAAVPIKSEKGSSVLIDLADLLMTDLANIGIQPDRSRSTWAKVKAFPENVEIEVSAVFSMQRFGYFSMMGGPTTPDPRGAQVVIHYGLSMLPSTDYKPRVADDRVGHFLSTLEDFSTDVSKSPRVRYVTRWHLVKSDSSADKSPPKEPIIFWIAKSVPRQYRSYVRQGILEWNKAFEKVGFLEAIQCRDQQSEDEFDPEDIRYNTFRWIATSAGFAMGPSRTNPKTGQILDADIVFDEAMLRYWRQEYLRIRGIPEALELLGHGQRQAFFKLYAADLPDLTGAEKKLNELFRQNGPQARAIFQPREPAAEDEMHLHLPLDSGQCCALGSGTQRQLSLLASVLAAQGKLDPGGKVPEEFIGQAIKWVVTHEVGHTLGLRHNFKASSAYSLKDLSKPDFTRENGMSGSIMDYLPANFALKGEKQGDYFSRTIGPYDYWAIEYAYKPISGDEPEELRKIASKATDPKLTFGTDQDLYLNPDPRTNAYDLGDPLEYAHRQVKLVKQSLDKLQDRVVAQGESWQRARDAFGTLLGELASSTYLASQYVGGEYTNRFHRGDKGAKPPLLPIEPTTQRDAMTLLKDEILAENAFHFSPELLRHLAPDQWYDESGLMFTGNFQFPIYDRILSIQRIVLSRFLDAEVMRTLQEAELLVEPDGEVLQLPEVFNMLTDSIWSELPTSTEKAKAKKARIEISTIRRNLQREHFKRLSEIVLGPKQSPWSFSSIIFIGSEEAASPDARSLARAHLGRIRNRIQLALGNDKIRMDEYSRSHLQEIRDRIEKVLNASLEIGEL